MIKKQMKDSKMICICTRIKFMYTYIINILFIRMNIFNFIITIISLYILIKYKTVCIVTIFKKLKKESIKKK